MGCFGGVLADPFQFKAAVRVGRYSFKKNCVSIFFGFWLDLFHPFSIGRSAKARTSQLQPNKAVRVGLYSSDWFYVSIFSSTWLYKFHAHVIERFGEVLADPFQFKGLVRVGRYSSNYLLIQSSMGLGLISFGSLSIGRTDEVKADQFQPKRAVGVGLCSTDLLFVSIFSVGTWLRCFHSFVLGRCDEASVGLATVEGGSYLLLPLRVHHKRPRPPSFCPYLRHPAYAHISQTSRPYTHIHLLPLQLPSPHLRSELYRSYCFTLSDVHCFVVSPAPPSWTYGVQQVLLGRKSLAALPAMPPAMRIRLLRFPRTPRWTALRGVRPGVCPPPQRKSPDFQQMPGIPHRAAPGLIAVFHGDEIQLGNRHREKLRGPTRPDPRQQSLPQGLYRPGQVHGLPGTQGPVPKGLHASLCGKVDRNRLPDDSRRPRTPWRQHLVHRGAPDHAPLRASTQRPPPVVREPAWRPHDQRGGYLEPHGHPRSPALRGRPMPSALCALQDPAPRHRLLARGDHLRRPRVRDRLPVPHRRHGAHQRRQSPAGSPDHHGRQARVPLQAGQRGHFLPVRRPLVDLGREAVLGRQVLEGRPGRGLPVHVLSPVRAWHDRPLGFCSFSTVLSSVRALTVRAFFLPRSWSRPQVEETASYFSPGSAALQGRWESPPCFHFWQLPGQDHSGRGISKSRIKPRDAVGALFGGGVFG